MNLLTLLYQDQDRYLSGEQLSQSLNITRAAIWKQVQSLRTKGVNIESSQSLGYKLIATNHHCDDIVLSNLLPNVHIEVHESLTSTNDYAKQIQQKPSLIVAQEQTQGKGRRGKSFFSPKGHGLYFSYIPDSHYTQEDMALITIKAAVALQETIESCFKKDTQIKWLNDIYLNDLKLAGILVEGSIELQTQEYDQVVIGIGCNLTQTKAPGDLEHIYTSLELENYDLHEFLHQFITKFEAIDASTVIETYKSMSMIIGREVIHSETNDVYTAEAIDANGALILTSPHLETLRLTYGEVSLKLNDY